jgi:hypothetical protein
MSTYDRFNLREELDWSNPQSFDMDMGYDSREDESFVYYSRSEGIDYGIGTSVKQDAYNKKHGIVNIVDNTMRDIIQPDFYVYKDVSIEDSAKTVIERVSNEDYFLNYQQDIGVLDGNCTIMTDDLVEKHMWKTWNLDREISHKDKARVALHRMGRNFSPIQNDVTRDSKISCTLKEIVCSFFQIEDCHTVKIDLQTVTAYYGDEFKEKREVDDFAQMVADYLPIDVKPNNVESASYLTVEACEDVLFDEFFLDSYGIDITDYMLYLPTELNKEKWSERERHISRLYEQIGDAFLLSYVVMNYLPNFTGVGEWSEYQELWFLIKILLLIV